MKYLTRYFSNVLWVGTLAAGLAGCATAVQKSPLPTESFSAPGSYQQVYNRLTEWIHACHGAEENAGSVHADGNLYGEDRRAYARISGQNGTLLSVSLVGNWSTTQVVASVQGQGRWNHAELAAMRQSLEQQQQTCATP